MKFQKHCRHVVWLWAVLLLCGYSQLQAQEEFYIEVTPATGPPSNKPASYSAKPENPATDMSHYDFFWIFEEGYYENGNVVSYKWQTHPAGATDSVVLLASKRYDDDTDPKERVGIVSPVDGILTPSSVFKMTSSLSREPRPGFESHYHLQILPVNPVVVIVTFDALVSYNDPAAGGAGCYGQFATLTGSAASEYEVLPKDHGGLAANQRAFFVSAAGNPAQSPVRADMLLSFCTADYASIDDDITIAVEVYEIQNAQLAQVIHTEPILPAGKNLRGWLADLTPIHSDVITEGVVNSWDPNSKSSFPDSVATPGGEIIYQIQYENVGDVLENKVIIYDTLPSWLVPGIYDVEFSNPGETTEILDDANPATYMWKVNDCWPHTSGFIRFRTRVKSSTPLGTIIQNRARIEFVNAGQDTLTNLTYNRVQNGLGTGTHSDPCQGCCKDPDGKGENDCPTWWRAAIAIMILLILLLLALLIRTLRRANGGS